MQDFPITMIRSNLDDLPSYALPDGYHIRTFSRGEEGVWADIEVAVSGFESREQALARFDGEFGSHLDEMEDRCFFLIHDETGWIIGTTTAWYDPDFQGENYGRIHWVAITPEFQGKKLAKPMLSAAMARLAQSHARAYLKTHTICSRAINIYLDFGFVPFVDSPQGAQAWRMLAQEIRHPVVERFLKESRMKMPSAFSEEIS